MIFFAAAAAAAAAAAVAVAAAATTAAAIASRAQILEEIKREGLTPDVSSFNIAVHACAVGRQWQVKYIRRENDTTFPLYHRVPEILWLSLIHI